MGKDKLDFENTELAFKLKSNAEIVRMKRLFMLMNNQILVRIGQTFGSFAVKYNFPFVKRIVKSTIFEQFCGGKTLLDSLPVIEKLYTQNVQTILDYGAEGKERDEDFNKGMNETLRALEFAASNPAIKAVSTKITGLTYNKLLEKISAGKSLSTQDEHEFESLRKRLDVICNKAHEVKVSIYIDAEESWIQEAIDQLVNAMMNRYNKVLPIVYNTFQLYRHNRLDNLKQSHRMAKEHGYILGAKLVRGAYLEKERKRAETMGYRSPIQVDKYSTDRSFNDALLYCLENVEEIAVVNASHNADSNYLMAQKISEFGIRLNHPNIHFSQLYGMSDNITFNLAHAGHSVSKYVPYGQIEDVIPYLIRRTQENTSVTGDLSRELKYIINEIKRRRL